jgi:hypothetical protein
VTEAAELWRQREGNGGSEARLQRGRMVAAMETEQGRQHGSSGATAVIFQKGVRLTSIVGLGRPLNRN